MNFKFWKSKEQESEQVPGELRSAADAKKAAQLALMATQLRDATRFKEQFNLASKVITNQILLGEPQTKLIILNKKYEDDFYKQFPNYMFEVKGLFDCHEVSLSGAQKYFKDQLNALGYQVTVRNINLQIRRIAGDTPNFFAGYELSISWG